MDIGFHISVWFYLFVVFALKKVAKSGDSEPIIAFIKLIRIIGLVLIYISMALFRMEVQLNELMDIKFRW